MRAVIVGDSIVKYVEQGRDDIKVYCKPGSYIEDMAAILNENDLLEKNVCDMILFHVGTNNLSTDGVSVNSCVDKMKELCHLVQEHCPNAKVCISGVLTRKSSLFRGSAQVDISEINQKIEVYNEQIEKFCSLYGVHFVDNSSFSRDHLSKDGLHLNFSGSHKLSQKLYSFIDKIRSDYIGCVTGVGLLTDEHYPPLPSDCTNVNIVERSVPYQKSGEKCSGWQQKYVKAQTVGESNNFAEKLHLLQQECDKSSVKTMKHRQRKPLIKNKKCQSVDQSCLNSDICVSEEQNSFSSVTGTGSYLKTSNRFQVFLSDTVDKIDEAVVFDDFDADMVNSELIRGEDTQNMKKKRSHQIKKRKNVKSCKNLQKNHLRSTCANDAGAQNQIQVPPSVSDKLDSTVYQVSVDISVVSSQPSHIIFNCPREHIPMSCIYSFVNQKTGVSVRSMFFKDISGQYIDKHSCLSCKEIENLVMFFKLKGGGRGRKRKGEDCHPNKVCGPCVVCGKVSFRYFHLSDREYDSNMINYFRSLVPTILDNDCICKGCDTGYRRKKNEKSNTNLKQDTMPKCHLSTYGLCQSEKERAIIVNERELVRIFNLPVASTQDINMSVMLCKDHRLKLFNMKNKCSVCTKQFIGSQRKYSLPDACADFVALYLSHIPGSESSTEELKISDLVFCGGCFYAIQKFMADNYKSQGGSCSYDSQIDSVKQIWSTDSCISNSPGMAHCIVSCCNSFVMHKPVLLANVYNDFVKHASQDECQNSNERWLLQKIIQIFGDSIQFITDEYRKMGTMLKRTDNNDNKALHYFLYNETFNRETSSSESTSELSKNKLLISVAELLRKRLYDQKQSINRNSLDLEKFDPGRFITESCDPVLFDFISILQGEKPCNFGGEIEFDKLNRTKALSCLNIICCILFSSDLYCRIPLHMLFSDVIDKYTNSSTECLRILNQFGICYSKSCLKEYQTSVIQKIKNTGVQLSPVSFTICSVDNINKRSSYASVKSSDLNRGFDGTSVQLVEPLPQTVKWDKNELNTPLSNCHTFQDKQGISYNRLFTASDLSLFRSIATLCFSDIRKGERYANGMLEDADKSEKETAISNSFYSYVNDIVQSFLETNNIFNVQYKETPVEYYHYLAISYLTSIPLNVFHIVKSNQIELFFQTNYQEMGKHMSSHVLNILKETDAEGVQFYPIFTSQSVFDENLVSEDFHLSLNYVDKDNELLGFSLFVESALPSAKISSDRKKADANACTISHEFVTQFSKLNLSFSSGRNLSSNENLISIPNDPYCFTDDPAEEMASVTIDRKSFAYCVKKYIAETNLNSVALPTFLQDLEFESVSETEKSNVDFLYVMEENADNRETIKLTLSKLYNDLGIHKNINYLVVVGDGKTYDHLVQLKNEFKDDLDWLLPYIGDWHVMKNYQLVLMKIYLDAGLKELVELFHQGVLAKVVSQATGFDKTHNFLIQCWEALFRFELEVFFLSRDRISSEHRNFDLDTVCRKILDYSKLVSEDKFDFQKVNDMVTGFQGLVDGINQEFYTFFDQLCSKNKTWKFWHNFIHVDCLTYIKYYIALRRGDWNLRNHCIKHIAKLAQVADSRYYCRLLPQNLVDIKRFPKFVIDHFRAGGFVMNVLGRNCHSQGLDEGHESCINKDVKAALNTCSQQALCKAVTYVPERANLLRKLKDFLGISSSQKRVLSSSVANSHEENVIAFKCCLEKSFLFAVHFDPLEMESETDNIHHLFSPKVCDNKQSDSLCNILMEGTKHLNLYIEKCQNIRNYALCRQKPLKLTGMFSNKNTVSAVRRELRDVQSQNRMFRIQIAWSVENNVIMGDLKQYLTNSIPRAIATLDNLPYKSDKSKILQAYRSRYPDICPSIFDISTFDSIILDGMFIIYSAPLRCFSTFSEYIQNLYRKYVSVYFDIGIKQVHVVFDDQNETCITPKSVERSRRDSDIEKPILSFNDFDKNSSLPRDWKKFLKLRDNKQKLIHMISEQFISLGCCHLEPHQSLILGGGFAESGIAKCVCDKQVMECAEYFSNVLEGDSRVWLHAFSNSGRRNLIYSPDNDVYHIGLPLLEKYPEKVIFVALDSQFESVLDMEKFSLSLKYDDKLGNTVSDILPAIQMLYVSTGCDYVSFFKDHGKKSFFDTFCKNADFISSGKEPFIGSLSQFHTQTESGFLAFLRLVGCEYFRKCAIEFKDNCPDMQIKTLLKYLSSSQKTPLENHASLINAIREALFKRCDEEHNIPTVEALRFHWLRSCWVCNVWGQADEIGILYPELNQYGWIVEDGKVQFVWDTDENIHKAQNRLKLWTEGCNCKTGCTTLRCGCRKNNNFCGPGCKCGSSCKNVSFYNDSHKSDTCTIPDPQLGTENSEASERVILPENDIDSSDEIDENDEYSDSEDFFPDC